MPSNSIVKETWLFELHSDGYIDIVGRNLLPGLAETCRKSFQPSNVKWLPRELNNQLALVLIEFTEPEIREALAGYDGELVEAIVQNSGNALGVTLCDRVPTWLDKAEGRTGI